MTFQQMLEMIAQLQAAVQQMQQSQAAFTQADLDAAIAKAKQEIIDADAAKLAELQAKIDELNAKIAPLQAQVDGLGAVVAGAVAAENARLLGIVKNLMDGEEAQVLNAMALPAPAPQA
jgi:chromosome segregation ATPase